jgi:hypothetical protein
MGIWARAVGKEAPRIRAVNVVPLDVQELTKESVPRRVIAEFWDRGRGVWFVDLHGIAEDSRFDIRKRSETSLVRAAAFAIENTQQFVNLSGQPYTLFHAFHAEGADKCLKEAAERGALGEAGIAAFGSSSSEMPLHPGAVTFLPMTP